MGLGIQCEADLGVPQPLLNDLGVDALLDVGEDGRYIEKPDPASQRRPCLPLTVGATNLRKGLSPSSQCPCWAHNHNAPGWMPRALYGS
jgi:hypothetical protein